MLCQPDARRNPWRLSGPASAVRSISHADLQTFIDVDYRQRFTQVAEFGIPGQSQIVGMGEYVLDPNSVFMTLELRPEAITGL